MWDSGAKLGDWILDYIEVGVVVYYLRDKLFFLLLTIFLLRKNCIIAIEIFLILFLFGFSLE